MQVISAWCNKDVGGKEPLDDTEVTRGMCKACYEEVTNDKGRHGISKGPDQKLLLRS